MWMKFGRSRDINDIFNYIEFSFNQFLTLFCGDENRLFQHLCSTAHSTATRNIASTSDSRLQGNRNDNTNYMTSKNEIISQGDTKYSDKTANSD
jgi:hypothetical protein